MRTLKRLVGLVLGRLGYEVRKTDGHRHRIGELSGLSFDEFLHCFLRAQDLTDFNLIQVGAHNGLSNDFVHDVAIKFRLKGILVEPQAAIFRELKATYASCPTVKLENIAISHQNGEQQLFTIRKELDFLQYANQVASFDYGHVRILLDRHLKTGAKAGVVKTFKARGLRVEDCIVPEPVVTLTFQSLLQKHGLAHYDLLQVDTEGFDFEVIKLAMVDQYRPSLINYEHEHLKPQDKMECWNYLKRLGYRLFTHAGDTTAYLIEAAANERLPVSASMSTAESR